MIPIDGRAARGAALAGSLLCAVGMFLLPYHVAVEPAISQSYTTGFNNHLALAIFVLGCALFSVAAGRGKAPRPSHDKPLPVWLLVGTVAVALALAVSWQLRHGQTQLGQEARYLVDRQVHVANGARLYRDIEYIYGPLMIYPGVLLQRWTALGAAWSYMVTWGAAIALGTGMLWFLVRSLQLPSRMRSLVFLLLYAGTLPLLRSEGIQYTPLRSCFAACLALLVAARWKRSHDESGTALLMVLAIAGGFAISSEQGIGLGIGLPAYALLLAMVDARRFRLRTAALVAGAALLCGVVALKSGALRTSAGVAHGGLNFPLLPSVQNFFFLGTYAAGCMVVYRTMRRREWESNLIPLGLCGVPMLNSALGRCDPGHMGSAMPLYVLGLFWFFSQRWLLAPWVLLMVQATMPLPDIGYLLHAAPRVAPSAALPAVPSPAAALPVGSGPAEGETIPEGRPYFAPFSVPTDKQGKTRWQAETGYFYGLQDVLTLRDGRDKATEIQSRRSPYLLLRDESPDAALFWAPEEDIRAVRGIEGSVWAPPERHPLPVEADLWALVHRMYRPTAMRQDGWRVWELR